MSSKTKAIILVISCVLIGFILGVALDRAVFLKLYHPSREKNYKKELVKRLNLNKEQQTRLDSILSWSQREFKNLSGEFRPRFDSLKSAFYDSVRSILTPEQLSKFEKMIKEKNGRR